MKIEKEKGDTLTISLIAKISIVFFEIGSVYQAMCLNLYYKLLSKLAAPFVCYDLVHNGSVAIQFTHPQIVEKPGQK